MPKYQCEKCGNIFNRKSNYDYHVYKKKRPCDKTNKEYQCNICMENFSNINELNEHLYDCAFDSAFDSTLDYNSESKNLKCNYCNKVYTRIDNLNRHLTKFCKVKKDIDNQKEIIYQQLLEQMKLQNKKMEKIIKENKKLQNQITFNNYQNNNKNTYNINNNNINNTQNINQGIINNINRNNIKIVAFGNEDLESIREDVIKSLLHKGFQSVNKTIEYVHFNKNKPENHNVYISNMKDLYAMIFDGEYWNLRDKKEIIDQLFEDKQMFLNEKFQEFIDNLDPITKKKFKRFYNLQDDTELIENLKKDVRLILYNKRKIPMETKNMLEKTKSMYEKNKIKLII